MYKKPLFCTMEMLYFWIKTIVTIVIISIVSSQSIQEPNDHSSTTHLNIEQINQNFVSRTKQNNSNALRNTSSESKNKPNVDDNSQMLDEANKAHSRKKRLIWITDDGRLALPPGTVLSLTPTISLPLVRYPLDGFLSNMTMSFPLTIDFDKLGLTDNENPLGVLPPIFARKMGRAAGSALGMNKYSFLFFMSCSIGMQKSLKIRLGQTALKIQTMISDIF